MKIVKSSYRIWEADIIGPEFGVQMLRKIEYIGRISHRSEDRITNDSYDRFLRSVVLSHGDMSIIEHASVTVEFEVDRGITHELVRHRLAAFTQESTRFVNYDKPEHEPRFIEPEFREYADRETWALHMDDVNRRYELMIRRGEAPQIARSVLPNALASKIVVTMNLRMWRHFFIMRTSREAHPQMREVVDPLLADFQAYIPILYEDIIPGTKQSEAMRLLR